MTDAALGRWEGDRFVFEPPRVMILPDGVCEVRSLNLGELGVPVGDDLREAEVAAVVARTEPRATEQDTT